MDTQQEEINPEVEIPKIYRDLMDIKDELLKVDESKYIKALDDVKAEMADLKKEIEKKNETIKLLTHASIDLINIDMELISNEIDSAQKQLLTIGTTEQFDIIRHVEKMSGVNMAYQKTKIFLEEAGHEAKTVIPTLNLINITLENVSEKLKYTSEA